MNPNEEHRAVVFCLVPRRLAGAVHDPLHRHFGIKRGRPRALQEISAYWPLPADSTRKSTRSWSSFGGRSS